MKFVTIIAIRITVIIKNKTIIMVMIINNDIKDNYDNLL